MTGGEGYRASMRESGGVSRLGMTVRFIASDVKLMLE